MAVVPLPGMPSVSSGTSAPPVSELFAPSGAATPSITPVPKPRGCFDTAFSMPYDRNEAIVEPAPGSTPTRNPMTDPLTNAKRQSLRSCHVGRRLRSPRGTGSIAPAFVGSMFAITSRDREHADRDDDEVDAAEELRAPEREARRGAEEIGADAWRSTVRRASTAAP